MKVNLLKRAMLPAFIAGAFISAALPVAMAAETLTNPKVFSKQVPGYYRMSLGDEVTVTAYYDGPVYLQPSVLKGVEAIDVNNLIDAMSVPVTKDGVQTSVNAYLIQQKDHLTLIDSGASNCFGETLGNLVDNIKASGISTDDVKAIIVTHLHPDHACGAIKPDGTAAFKNAVFIAPKEDADYWLSEANAKSAPEGERSFFLAAQRSVAPYIASGRFRTFTKGESPVPGIQSVDEAGHSPGMTGYLISGAGKDLLVWGDVIHNHAVQFKHPEVSVVFDHDSKAAIETRKRILNDAAQGKLWIAAAHLPFPGIGHVVADGKGYRWIPVEYSPVR